MIQYSIEQARQSDQATFPFRIIFLDYRLIGTHEDQETKAEQQVYDSMLERGYDGPPIAVFQSEDDTLFDLGPFDAEVSTDYGKFGVVDGHHRFKSIRLLGERGLLKEAYVPVQLVPAHNPEVVRIGTLHDDEQPLSIEQVEGCFIDPVAVIPLCTSHFQTKLANDEWVRLQASQPNIKVDIADFIARQ